MKQCLHKTISLFAGVFFALCSEGVVAQSRLVWEDYSHRLSEHMLTDMQQDGRGFLWFSTWNGLHRFDGYDFKNYKTYLGEACVMESNRLLMIRLNQSGKIWCLDYGRNIYLFDPTEERFFDLRRWISPSPVHNIITCADSTSYFVAEDRLVCVDERRLDPVSGEGVTPLLFADSVKGLGTKRVVDVVHPAGSEPWIVTDRSLLTLHKRVTLSEKVGRITAVTHCDGRIYLLTDKRRLGCFTPSKCTLMWEQLPIEVQQLNRIKVVNDEQIAIGTDRGLLVYSIHRRHFSHLHPVQSGCGSNNVTDIFTDSHNNLWIYTDRDGVVRHDPATGEMQWIKTPSQDVPQQSVKSTVFCFEDKQGTQWIVPRGGSLGWFDRKAKQLRTYYTDPNQPNTKFTPITWLYLFDRQGNLWYSGVSGLYRLSFSATNITYQPLDEGFETRALMNDLNGRLWVATKKGYIRIYNPDRTLAGYLGTDGRIHTTPCTFAGNVYCFLEDDNGVIWMGIRLRGLVRLDPTGNGRYRVTRYEHDPRDRYSLSENSIFDLFKDSHDRLWVCTYGGGINCIRTDEQGRLRFIHSGNELKHWPAEHCSKTRRIIEWGDVMLVGTTAGLVTFDADSDDLANLHFYQNRLRPTTSSCLPANDIHSIFVDSRDDCYVMSFSGGISRILSEELLSEQICFQNYSVKDGLSSELPHAMVEDRMGKLWIIYENAVNRFDPESGRIESYGDARYGYAECEPLFYGDQLLIGTANGLAYIEPEKLHKSDYVPPMALLSLTIQNTGEVRVIDHLERLSLQPDERDIQLHFAALDYAGNASLRYAYRMAGLDKEWVQIGGQPTASYTNLPAGRYRFEIRSTNSDGVWVDNLRTLEIEVVPTFWEPPLATVLLVLAALILILGAIQLRLHIFRLRNRIRIEEHLTDVKLRFFTDVSHELRTPLTLIASPVDEVLQREQLSEQGRRHLQIVSQNTQRMLRLINQILDFRKIEDGKMKLMVEQCDLAVLMARIAENFHPISRRQHNTFRCNLPPQGSMGWVDRDKVEKICYNLLSNAFKYTPDGRVIRFDIQIAAARVGGILRIVVSDEGIGMDSRRQAKLFRRFESILGTTNFPSSGIGLSLVKELIDLMQGDIQVESTPNVGSSFTVTIPIDRRHYEQLPHTELILGDVGEGRGEASPTEVPEEVTPRTQQPTLLIVEDNCELSDLLRDMLATEYHILTASNGVEGLQLAREALPDLILTDVMMPEMDGLEMVRAIKENHELCHLPIIVLSAKSSLDDRINGLEYGIDDYITKPFVASYLKVRIRALMERYRQLRERLLEELTKEQGLAPRFEIPEPEAPHILSSDEQFMRSLMEVIERNMDRAEMTIEDYASELHMAHSTFYNKVKSLIGITPVEFVREMRLKRGHQLLQSGAYDVSTVCYMVGFSDPRYFSKCFKKRFGISPSQLRASEQE